MSRMATQYADFDVVPPGQANDISSYSEIEAGNPNSRKREALVQALTSLHKQRLEMEEPVSPNSYRAAQAFIKNLPLNRKLPRVGLDEDGDVLLRWEETTIEMEITVQDTTLHIVIKPGSASTHIGPVDYSGGYLPVKVLSEVPRI